MFPPKSDRALKKWTHSKTDSTRHSKDDAPSPKRATIKKEMDSDDNESSSSTGLSDETLHDHRFTVYGRDSTAVHEVRAKILGLESEMRSSQQDIDSSPILALRRVADESWPPSIIGKHWVLYLEQKGHLADFSYKDGWLPLYTRAGLTKHLTGLESLLNNAKCFFSELCKELFTGFLVPGLFGSRLHLLSEVFAFVLGNVCERFCASRPLLGSYVHQESI